MKKTAAKSKPTRVKRQQAKGCRRPSSGSWFFVPLSDDHSEEHPATLAYVRYAGDEPQYSKCHIRREDGSWMGSTRIPNGFTADDLRRIADHMDSTNAKDQATDGARDENQPTKSK